MVKGGKTVAEAARALGLVEQTLRNWVKLAAKGKLHQGVPPRQNSCRLDRILILGALKELMWLAMDKHSRIVR
jgi:transposase-like protein